MEQMGEEPDDIQGQTISGPGSDVEFWILTPGRRALHWGLTLAILAIVVIAVVNVAYGQPNVFELVTEIGFVCCALPFIGGQLRAVVAVWLDPTDGSLTLFRTAGGSIHTYPTRVRRIDHGRIDGYYRSPNAHYLPTRIVTDAGTATLSRFLQAPEQLAEAIAARNPQVHINL